MSEQVTISEMYSRVKGEGTEYIVVENGIAKGVVQKVEE